MTGTCHSLSSGLLASVGLLLRSSLDVIRSTLRTHSPQCDRFPLGLPQSGLGRNARLPPGHLVASLVRIEETEEQHRSHVGNHAVELALRREAMMKLHECLFARRV